MGVPGKRRTGSKSRGAKVCKTAGRAQFQARHLDLVWEDIRAGETVHDKKTGPVGNKSKTELDTDLPASGQHYCVPCSRYFLSQEVLLKHEATKAHKRRVKALFGAKPHTQTDADRAGGMGAPDNGRDAAAAAGPASMDVSSSQQS